MSERVVDTPQEDLQYIPQTEGGGDFESERGIWEAEAIRELFDSAPEAFGPDISEEQLYDRLFKLSRVVRDLSLTPEQRSRMKSQKELPVITTQAGLSELLSQVSGLAMSNEKLLACGDIAFCLSTITQSMERMLENGEDLDDQRFIQDLNTVLAINSEQAKINPNLSFSSYQRKDTYKLLSKHYLAQLVLEDPEDPEGILTPQIHELWHDPDFLEVMSEIDVDTVSRADNKLRSDWEPVEGNGFSEFEIALRHKIFTSLGFDKAQGSKIRAGWGSKATDTEYGRFDKTMIPDRPEYIARQYKALFELARVDFDAPKKLFDQFGIRHFGRYATKDLIDQLNYEPKAGDDLEICISAADDWNDFLSNQRRVTKGLNFSHPIYYECSTIIELTKNMIKASKRYGAIKKLLISGHGAPDHFVLGKRREYHSGVVDINSIKQSRGVGRLTYRDILSEDCQILISSCSVGKPRGIAEAISKATGLRTISPDDVSQGLIYDTDQGDYDALYRDTKGKSYGRDAAVYDLK
ncbi:hypothetical protein H6800_02420 [Candidatus Nomurabacteria bacterium]|nr:hypothetical protein [Candidatus Nomurabacteria bacterium]